LLTFSVLCFLNQLRIFVFEDVLVESKIFVYENLLR
jgi:hypothetical protein